MKRAIAIPANPSKPGPAANNSTEARIELIDQIIKTRSPVVKTFWISVSLLCCSGLTYGIYMESMDYFHQLKATRIYFESHREMRLPDLSICSPNPLNISKLKTHGFAPKEISMMHLHFQENPYKQITGLKNMQQMSKKINFTEEDNKQSRLGVGDIRRKFRLGDIRRKLFDQLRQFICPVHSQRQANSLLRYRTGNSARKTWEMLRFSQSQHYKRGCPRGFGGPGTNRATRESKFDYRHATTGKRSRCRNF